jgi:hypothetical protein
MKLRALAIVSAASLLMLAAETSLAQLYVQNPNFDGAFASQNDTNGLGNFATVYDNFTIGFIGAVNQVDWIGSYFNPPQQGVITAWTVTFYADNAGQPGSALASFSIPGNGNETFLQNDNLGDPTYLYTAAMFFPFSGHTQYWLSVVPDLGIPPQWGWETSSQGDGIAYQDFFGVRTQVPSDFSFALFGGQILGPEPGTLVILGTGILGVAGTLRRRLF